MDVIKRKDKMIKIQNFINGKHQDSLSNEVLDNYNPAIGKVYSTIPDSNEDDVSLAVDAAKKAFPIWKNYSIEQRYECLNKLSILIEENLDEFALAESTDNGKPLWLATHVDIPRAASNFRFYATAIMHFASESHEMTGNAINYTLRHPIGVVSCISPWNLPLYLFSWKIAPALAAGNCVVAKPSEVTPMTAYLLSKLINEAGFPPGVLNIVHGLGHKTGQAMVTHPDVKAISFTGGTTTGAHIASLAAPKFKKLSLELGGKNPNIIFDDCDYDKMLKTTVLSSFSNQGQICLCGSRILIQDTIYEKFKKDFVEKVKRMKVGNPADEKSRMGAVVSDQHMKKVLKHIEIAKEEGGEILCGGHQIKMEGELEGGWYIAPTVIENLDQTCKTNTEEIFGPVVSLQSFSTPEEALELANAVEYGLSATIWTKDLEKATYLSREIEAGIVWINCWLLRDLRTPFGGTKSSGVGREGGWEALRFFTEPKNVCIKY